MLTSSSLAWYRLPRRPPSELGSPMLRIGYPAAASPSADRGDRYRIGFQAGSQDCCYGNARLFLAGSFRVIGGAAPPPESRIPAAQRAARRLRRFRVDQSGRRQRGRLDSRRVNAYR